MLFRSLQRAAAFSRSLKLEHGLQHATTVANPLISRTISKSAIANKGMMAAQYKSTGALNGPGSVHFFPNPVSPHQEHHHPKVTGEVVDDSKFVLSFITEIMKVEDQVRKHDPKITKPKKSVEIVEMNVPIKDINGNKAHVPTLIATPSNWDGKKAGLYVLGSGHLERGEIHITQLIAEKMADGLGRRFAVPIPRSQRYPVPSHDVDQVCRYFAEHNFAIDTSQFMIAGYSGGASAAFYAAAQAQKDGRPVQALLMVSPFLSYARGIIDKIEEFRVEDKTLPRGFVNAAIKHYLGDTYSPYDPLVSPLFIEMKNLREMKLPPTIITVGREDGVLGDAKLMAAKLRNAEVTVVELEHRGIGSNHGHWWHSDRSHETTYAVTRRVLKDNRPRVYIDDSKVLKEFTHGSSETLSVARRRRP